MDADRVNRYARHITLPEVGADGQETLLAATVLLVDHTFGADVILQTARAALQAAGVGTVKMVTADSREKANVVLATSDRGAAVAENAGAPLVLAVIDGDVPRVKTIVPGQDSRSFEVPGHLTCEVGSPAARAASVAAGGLAAAEVLWQTLGKH